MPDFQIFEEIDSGGLFQRRTGIFSAPDPERALKNFVVNHKPYVPYKEGERFIVLRAGAEPTYCHLLKLVAPPHTWDVERA
jgi:hypothetical protein